MAKYDSVLGDLKNNLSAAKKILVALPSSINVDTLASGLALFLSLKQSGKEASIVTSDSIKVSHSNLFGVGQVESQMPEVSGGDLTLTLEGVVLPDGSVPALEKLDWFPEGANLNLVFHVLPGQKFEPKRIVPSVGGAGGFDIIFVIGAPSLEALGDIYNLKKEVFSSGKVVNIDKSTNNTNFGAVNVVDSGAATISEIVAQVISGLGLPFEGDIASNILAGVYKATSNLTTNTKPETFISVGYAMQSGGKLPEREGNVVVNQSPSPTPQSAPSVTPAQEYAQNFPPLNQVFGFPVQSGQIQAGADNFTVPPVVNSEPQAPTQSNQPSSEERPMGEYASSSNPETGGNPDPDWLTPKVYKGTNIG